MCPCTIPKEFFVYSSHLTKVITPRSVTKEEGSECRLSNFEVLKTRDQPDEDLFQKLSF